MNEHTPGPWQQYGSLIYSEHGMICELSDPHVSTTITHTPLGLGSHDWPEATANAALIAAAPDLLAACEAWARIMDAMGHLRYAELLQNGLPVDAGDLAVYLTRTAIQKARGEENGTDIV